MAKASLQVVAAWSSQFCSHCSHLKIETWGDTGYGGILATVDQVSHSVWKV